MALCAAGGSQFHGIKACLQNLNLSSCKPKLSPLGHTMSKGNMAAGGTTDEAVSCHRGVSPNDRALSDPMLLDSRSQRFAEPPVEPWSYGRGAVLFHCYAA